MRLAFLMVLLCWDVNGMETGSHSQKQKPSNQKLLSQLGLKSLVTLKVFNWFPVRFWVTCGSVGMFIHVWGHLSCIQKCMGRFVYLAELWVFIDFTEPRTNIPKSSVVQAECDDKLLIGDLLIEGGFSLINQI